MKQARVTFLGFIFGALADTRFSNEVFHLCNAR